jgi:DNA-binding LytR/AlgR family response regulator
MANCLIVDDEPLSRDVLRKYIGEVKDLSWLQSVTTLPRPLIN